MIHTNNFILAKLGGEGGLVVKRRLVIRRSGVQTPPQPPGRKNEKWTLG